LLVETRPILSAQWAEIQQVVWSGQVGWIWGFVQRTVWYFSSSSSSSIDSLDQSRVRASELRYCSDRQWYFMKLFVLSSAMAFLSLEVFLPQR
jgi:hypothetical protein